MIATALKLLIILQLWPFSTITGGVKPQMILSMEPYTILIVPSYTHCTIYGIVLCGRVIYTHQGLYFIQSVVTVDTSFCDIHCTLLSKRCPSYPATLSGNCLTPDRKNRHYIFLKSHLVVGASSSTFTSSTECPISRLTSVSCRTTSKGIEIPEKLLCLGLASSFG